MLYRAKEKGQGMMEYALIVALIAVLVILILSITGTLISTAFSQISSTLGG